MGYGVVCAPATREARVLLPGSCPATRGLLGRRRCYASRVAGGPGIARLQKSACCGPALLDYLARLGVMLCVPGPHTPPVKPSAIITPETGLLPKLRLTSWTSAGHGRGAGIRPISIPLDSMGLDPAIHACAPSSARPPSMRRPSPRMAKQNPHLRPAASGGWRRRRARPRRPGRPLASAPGGRRRGRSVPHQVLLDDRGVGLDAEPGLLGHGGVAIDDRDRSLRQGTADLRRLDAVLHDEGVRHAREEVQGRGDVDVGREVVVDDRQPRCAASAAICIAWVRPQRVRSTWTTSMRPKSITSADGLRSSTWSRST